MAKFDTDTIHIPAYGKTKAEGKGDLMGDTKIEMSVQCLECTHLDDGLLKCEAFPEGIPKIIHEGNFDHSKTFEGDKGIRFEAFDENF